MPSERALLERQMAEVELRPLTLDGFYERRHRKQRNRRIATAAMGFVLAAVVAGGILGSLGIGRPEGRLGHPRTDAEPLRGHVDVHGHRRFVADDGHPARRRR